MATLMRAAIITMALYGAETVASTVQPRRAIAVAANLTVNGATQLQVIDGMGVSVNVDSWNDGEIIEALDLLVNQNGVSLVRVLRDPMDWVSSESLIPALHNLDQATLEQVYETPAMRDIWGTIEILNQLGIRGHQIELVFMGWTPTWIGGSGQYGSISRITAGKEDEFATMVASLVYYGRFVKNLDFSLLAPLNEPDHQGIEGPQVGPSQNVTVLTALIAELDYMNLQDVRLVGPETSGSAPSYMSAMMANPTVSARVDHLAYHTYGNPAVPGTSYPGKNYWMSETAANCGACNNNDPPSQGEFTFASATGDIVLGHLDNGFGAVLVWEGFDSFYHHHNSTSSWGLLAYGGGAYTPRKRFYVNAQINKFIRPGARVVDLTESVSGLGPVLAFRDDARGTVSIVGHVTSSTPVSIQGQLDGLPFDVTSLANYQTSATVDLQRQADVPVTGGAFNVTIPANTFFSLTGGTPPPVADIDLVPGPVTVTPDPAIAGQTARYSFTLSNEGSSPAPGSRWVLTAGSTVLGQGNASVPGNGSVSLEVFATIFSAGNYPLRLVVDSLATVPETNETNNASMRTLTVATGSPTFPQTVVLDDFNRPNGALGGNWVDETSAFSINNNQLAPGSDHHYIEWNGAIFGPDQEVFVTLGSVAPFAPEHNLMLKTQGSTWTDGHLEVSYEATTSRVWAYTYTPPGTWADHGAINDVTFAAGDQFGARALSDGTVYVYKNGFPIGALSVAGWVYAAQGGRIGVSVANATTARFDDFGGGNVPDPLAVDPPPSLGRLWLSGAFPNPARGGVTLALELPLENEVSLSILDIQGREVWSAPSQRRGAGRWSLAWDGQTTQGAARAGVYLARVRVGGQLFMRRVAIIR